jgi:curved DNA-binding protein CbpA
MRELPLAIASFVERAHAAMDGLDYYGILGVTRAAGEEEVRGAYYRLARRLHPDVYGDAISETSRRKLTAVFSRVVEAYQVLSSAEMRARYDELVAGGLLRWDAGEARRPEPAPELSIQHPGARRFFRLATDAAGTGDWKTAVTNFRLALSLDADNTMIRARLAEAEAALEERKGR